MQPIVIVPTAATAKTRRCVFGALQARVAGQAACRTSAALATILARKTWYPVVQVAHIYHVEVAHFVVPFDTVARVVAG